MGKKVLIKDLVIKKGTIFEEIPKGKKTVYGENHFSSFFGLSNDTYGEIIYSFDDSVGSIEKEKLEEYFIALEG